MDSLENAENRTARTANGAVTLHSTKNYLLDFYSRAGAMRNNSDTEVITLFSKAFSEDPINALKALFYIRDIRGGQGERKVFRTIWSWLADNYPDVVRSNIDNVPFFGRWDDLFSSPKATKMAIPLISSVIDSAKNENTSFDKLNLLKWLPSNNTSSNVTRQQANYISALLGMSKKEYRKMLSKYRSILDIVEKKMSANKWKEITYSKVPSRASLLYRKAFWKHDNEGYAQYLTKVEKGEAKINTSVTYPYEVVREYLVNGNTNNQTLNLIWKNLPDYVEEEQALVMADVSGSMNHPNFLPLSVSISLALYFAERNKNSEFKNRFLTFSSNPSLVKIVGNNLYEKIMNINKSNWDMSTNIQKAFDLILGIAVSNNVPKEDMPRKLYIISDMQFDEAGGNKTNFEVIKQKYASSGYELPVIVFWNVNNSNQESPVTYDQKGTMLVSGCSPNIFKAVMNSKAYTPYDMMMEVLSKERYSRIRM